MSQSSAIDLLDLAPAEEDIRTVVMDGLSASPRTLPPRLFYDHAGSELFERICDLPTYYLTRTELAILDRDLPEMAQGVGPDTLIFEYGSGAGVKTRKLLHALPRPAGYVPIEISRQALLDSVDRLAEAFPDLPIQPVCADYNQPVDRPAALTDAARRSVLFFPGSTLGNLHPEDARGLFRRTRDLVGPGGGMLLGVDLIKSPDLLIPAYADPQGVTAAFNLNLLRRLNREVGADFDLKRWEHRAVWNDEAARMESHLVSVGEQAVHVGGRRFAFDSGDGIWTESSYKFTPDAVAELAEGFDLKHQWTDDRGWFAVMYLEAV
jgi:dimethylhistidine N-methyltransferase